MSLQELERMKEYSFEMGPIRPPSEGGSRSLLIRATRNCPWSLCKFCYGTFYNRERFQLRSVEEIKKRHREERGRKAEERRLKGETFLRKIMHAFYQQKCKKCGKL